MQVIHFTVLIILVSFFELSCCERLHEQIYSSIEGSAACFRRLNGTHQAGCSSSNSGGVGVVLMVKDYSDAQWLVNNATAGPYMAVVNTVLFNDVMELFMTSPHNVAGVLLFDNSTQRADSFTQEMQCPNRYSSAADSQCPSPAGSVWNKGGTGLLRRDIPFPIFYLPQTRYEEIVKIEDCHDRYNLDKKNQKGVPLCSVQLNSFMFAAVDTTVCMRRSASTTFFTPIKVCDPLGDYNVYYSLFPRAKETNTTKKSVTLVTGRIDSATLFDGVAPGAASSVVGIVSMITAAAALSKMIPTTEAEKYDNNVLWTFFNGEAFDYIGSQRVAYDLKRGSWPQTPLSPNDIKLHVDIGQLGGALADKEEWMLRAYVPYGAGEIPPKVTEFLAQLSNYVKDNTSLSIEAEFTTNLPPSALHSFRNILSNVTKTGELPELVLVDHNETFTNKFYHSVLDEYEAVDFVYRNITIGANGKFMDTDELISSGLMKESDMQVKIARLATVLSRTLSQQVTGSVYSGNLTASAHMVDELLFCFLQSQACPLLMSADYAASEHDAAPARPTPLYVGVAAWASPPAVFVGHLLALLAGDVVPGDRKHCDALNDPDYSHYWLRGWDLKGVCVQTTMNFSQAVSPAFIAQGYDLRSGVYSTWTESVWQSMWARVFVSSAGVGAATAAATGAVATLLTAALTFWLKRHADLLFVNTATVPQSDHAAGILRTVNC